MAVEELPEEVIVAAESAVEGCADFFMGRPLDANPYAKTSPWHWRGWRSGWIMGSHFHEMRAEEEHKRWRIT